MKRIYPTGKFKKLLIRKTKLPKEVHDLFPSTYQAIGDICLIKTSEFVAQRYGHQIGGIILDNYPQFRTVCMQGKIFGKLRKPKIEVIAGDKNTETLHREVGCAFKLDVAKMMWSKGNHQERKRMMKTVRKNEVVLDMFSGVGYWSIPVAKHSQPKKVYAIELNPVAFEYLEENIRLNRLTNIVAIKGDCSKVMPKIKVDRIIMGLLPSSKNYISTALKAAKKGTIIHYHGTAPEGKEKNLLKDFGKTKVKLLKITRVKSYAPRIAHFVLDIRV